jgi:hypothetical protein
MRHAIVLVLVGAACGTTPLVSPQPVSPDAVRKACAMELSCLSPPPITLGGSCVVQFEEGLATGYGIFFGPSAADLTRYVSCVGAHSDCTSALNCASKNHGPDWCAAHAKATCDGDTLVGCIGGWGLELTNCATFGLHCVTANGQGVCTDGNPCDPTVSAHCSGNRYITCDSTTRLGRSIDCGTFVAGGTCRQIVSGSTTETGCFGPGSATCPASVQDMSSCDGTAVVACSYGTSLRVECGEFQSHCVAAANGKYGCTADASECTQNSPDSCVGNAIQMCVNGKWTATACSSLGLSTCQTTSTGVKCG